MLSLPRTGLPSANAPSSLTRNQVPNSAAFVRARHTRVRGARSTTRFSIRSVLFVSLGVSVLTAMGSFLRDQVKRPLLDMQHSCCVLYPPPRLNATPMLRFVLLDFSSCNVECLSAHTSLPLRLAVREGTLVKVPMCCRGYRL